MKGKVGFPGRLKAGRNFKRIQSLGIVCEMCRRALVNDIKAYSYIIRTRQAFIATDEERRKAMAVKMLEKIS